MSTRDDRRDLDRRDLDRTAARDEMERVGPGGWYYFEACPKCSDTIFQGEDGYCHCVNCNWSRNACQRCKGTGHVLNDGLVYVKCPACNGAGYVQETEIV